MASSASVQRDVPDVIVQCTHCNGSSYRLGSYDEHVRESMHDGHDKDRALYVDLEGRVSRRARPSKPSCEDSVGK